MNKKWNRRLRIRVVAALAAVTLTAAGCSASPAGSTLAGTASTQIAVAGTAAGTQTAGTAGSPDTSGVATSGESQEAALTVEYSSKDLETTVDETDATKIRFGDQITVSGEGAQASDKILTISQAGTYLLSGESADGQIVVNAPEDADVILVLNGLKLTCPSASVLHILEADQVILTLTAGSENVLTDGVDRVQADSEATDAAIYSKADLTINGSGSLKVTGQYAHGIVSKDDLKIVSGQITITAVKDGLQGKDLVAIRDGNLTITAGGDGIQSTNDEEAAKGGILIENGIFDLTAGQDGIQAETSLWIKNGTFRLVTGGGSANSSQTSGWGNWGSAPASDSQTSDSAKGLKAGTALVIDGGVIQLDSSDDAVHSNGDVTINGGAIELSSGDDGIHADQALLINAGDIYIETSYEGLEGASVTIRDGKVHVGAMDDGINTSGGNDGSSVSGRPGQNGFDQSDGTLLSLLGGYVFIDSAGDGIDANGDIVMEAATVIVNGPTNNGNGAVDYAGTFTLNSGTLLALGSSGMAQNISETSSQAAFLLNTSEISADTLVRITSSDGTEQITFSSPKPFSSILYSSSDLKAGDTCLISSGGTSDGTATDGIIQGGTWSGGTQLTQVEMTSAQTTIGGGIGSGPGGMKPGLGNPGKRP